MILCQWVCQDSHLVTLNSLPVLLLFLSRGAIDTKIAIRHGRTYRSRKSNSLLISGDSSQNRTFNAGATHCQSHACLRNHSLSNCTMKENKVSNHRNCYPRFTGPKIRSSYFWGINWHVLLLALDLNTRWLFSLYSGISGIWFTIETASTGSIGAN